MSSTNGTQEDASTKRWEGYSDYRSVSERMAKSLDDALEAYAVIESRHAAGTKLRDEEIARCVKRLLTAAMKLTVELEADRNAVNTYDEILTRWQDGPGDDDPYLEAIRTTDLKNQRPDWFDQFAKDIRTAGWELGYLQAGRTISESNLEPAEEEARSMFE
jgi:hypothetical protein